MYSVIHDVRSRRRVLKWKTIFFENKRLPSYTFYMVVLMHNSNFFAFNVPTGPMFRFIYNGDEMKNVLCYVQARLMKVLEIFDLRNRGRTIYIKRTI